ncbi:MAG: RNA polymerase sigma factor, partial [Planctomycetota bacterium]
AEDLAQDCLLRGFRRLSALQDANKFGSWLLTIGYHAALDWKKSRARSEVALEDLGAGMQQSDERGVRVDDRLMQQEQQAELRQAIDQLPDPQREALLIYYYDDVTYDQLGEMLGISSAAVNARLTKARAALRRSLGAKWCSNEVH